jgi:hypothetical protein
MLHVVRKRDSTDCYIERIKAAITAAHRAGIALTVRIAVTCGNTGGNKSCCGSNCQCHNFDIAPNQELDLPGPKVITQASDEEKGIIPIETKQASETSSLSISPSMEKGAITSVMIERPSSVKSDSAGSETSLNKKQITYTSSRPDIGSFIRRPVEATGGETQIAVCGGKSIVACVRNNVAALSDERGVHKGTGAQGIALFTEHYCF